jgi:hypothetical protein
LFCDNYFGILISSSTPREDAVTSDSLARFSQRMAAVTLCFIVAMLLLNAACWFFPSLNSVTNGYGFGFSLTDKLISNLNIDVAGFPWWQKAGCVLISSVPLLALAHGLRHLRLLFRSYARREYFSAAATTHLGKVGKSVAVWVLLGLLCEPILSVWSTIRAPVGHRVITLSFGSPDVVALFLAACIAVIAHILKQASELDSEHRQFV